MPHPAFASHETNLATLTLAMFENVRLQYGASVLGAVLDNNVETVGEYGLTGERRSRIRVLRSDSTGFTGGATIAADPATYTADELAAMERSSWILDRIESDDGQHVTWWLK